jgi:hypothetical protein
MFQDRGNGGHEVSPYALGQNGDPVAASQGHPQQDGITSPVLSSARIMRDPATGLQNLGVHRSKFRYHKVLPTISPATSSTTKTTMKMKNRMRAMSAEAAAMPPNPKSAATIDTTRKNKASRSMAFLLRKLLPVVNLGTA